LKNRIFDGGFVLALDEGVVAEVAVGKLARREEGADGGHGVVWNKIGLNAFELE
jgi:hypothetical protein